MKPPRPRTARIDVEDAIALELPGLMGMAADDHVESRGPRVQVKRMYVSGHSHQPGKFERNGVLYINPGSAGPRRFHLPVSVARLNLGSTPFEVELVELQA